MNYQPVGDNLQLELPTTAGIKVGNLWLPQNAKGAPTVLARVLAVGPLCKQVKVGQKAVIATNQVIMLKLDGEAAEVAFTKEDRVLAVTD